MKNKTPMLVIAKDGYPLETIKGKWFVNWIRRLFHSSHKECRECYNHREKATVNTHTLKN